MGGLLKLTFTRVLFAVDKAYPELAEAAARIRNKARKRDDHAFEAGRIKVEVKELAKRIRELEPRQPSEAEETAAPRARRHSPPRPATAPTTAPPPTCAKSCPCCSTASPSSNRWGRPARLIAAIDDPNDRTLLSILIDRSATLINDMCQAIDRERAN